MYPPPDGQDLTEEQARELDDTFLASDPFQYFSSRIASLLTWHESAPVSDAPLPEPEPGSIRAEFNQYLQRPAADGPFKDLDVHAQVAADALALRHHAAEALLRLACARLAPSTGAGVPCLWAEIAAGPTQITEVIERLNASTREADPGGRMLCALVEPRRLETARSSPEIVDACNVFVEWLGYAAGLLSPAEIDLQAGHNKVKAFDQRRRRGEVAQVPCHVDHGIGAMGGQIRGAVHLQRNERCLRSVQQGQQRRQAGTSHPVTGVIGAALPNNADARPRKPVQASAPGGALIVGGL